MATVQLALYSVMLLHARVQGFTISPQIPNPIFVKKGEEVTLFCNYTLAGENNNVMSADLYVNGTNDINRVFTFAEIPGSILRQNFSKHLASRSDVFFHNVKSPTNYVAVEIQRAQFSDTGNYTWALNINFGRDQYSGIIETIVGESPERATYRTTHISATIYELQCEVIGGIPVPDIQIRNTNQILLRSPSSSSASLNITVTSEDQYYCTGTNGLGSVTSNYVILPEPETTASVSDTTDEKDTKDEALLDDPGKTAGIVIGILLGFLVVAISIGFVLYKRLYKKESLLSARSFFRQTKQEATNSHVYEMPASNLDVQPYTEVSAGDHVRELTANNIRLLETIGHGHFGEVYKAILKNAKTTNTEKIVAVKLLKEQYSEVDKKEFFREIETMQLVPTHENVVAMLGYCKTATFSAFLVLEYLGNGNLKTYLRKSRSNNIYGNLHGGSGKLTSQNLLTFALDSARGMAHISRFKFLHRDLAARNILVSDDMVCKVSDFGLARDVIDSREYLSKMETPLPIRWMAPESMSDSVYTTKSDVWSFGVLLWEIVTLGATPYPGITSGRELIREIRSGYRMEKPQHCTQELYNMMMTCWEEEPTNRPTFDNIVTSLRGMANEEMKLHVDVDRAAEAIYCDIDSQLVGEIV